MIHSNPFAEASKSFVRGFRVLRRARSVSFMFAHSCHSVQFVVWSESACIPIRVLLHLSTYSRCVRVDNFGGVKSLVPGMPTFWER